MRNKYLKLTKDQRERGVVFSSQLISTDGTAGPGEIKEIMRGEEGADIKQERLRDASFFANSPWDVNEIRR